MKIILVSVDHTSAGIELRERFSFTENSLREAIRSIRENYPVDGVVLLSTCNRTELYLSGGDVEKLDPVAILQEAACTSQSAVGTATNALSKCSMLKSGNQMEVPFDAFRVWTGEQASLHLMEVACGLKSRILCEDQIITQVKRAAAIAREEHTSDPVLSTLFRLAATAAKKAKTSVIVKAIPISAAENAVMLLERQLGGLSGKQGLVIGNGEMGRLCASRLEELGCKTTITLRTYRHGETMVPRGCKTIPYEERGCLLPEMDFVVSATASPHYTLTREMLSVHRKLPQILIDLAVPRDIDPEIQLLTGITCYNIDSLGCGPIAEEAPELVAVRKIIAEQLLRFSDWLNIHDCRDGIQNIKRLTYKKVSGGLIEESVTEEERQRIELTVHKTVDLLMYSIKDELSPELVERIEKHILTSKNGGKPVE